MKFSEGQKIVLFFQVMVIVSMFILLSETASVPEKIEELYKKIQWVEVDLDMVKSRTDQSLSLTKLELIKEIEGEIKNTIVGNSSCVILPNVTSTTL